MSYGKKQSAANQAWRNNAPILPVPLISGEKAMLNFECIDKIENEKVELCFTDSDGDESVRIIVTQKTAWDIVKEIQRKFSYAALKGSNG